MWPRRFNIYAVTSNGTARWLTTAPAESASDALVSKAQHGGLVREGPVYFVVDPTSNPDGDQALFRVVPAPSPGYRAIAVGLDEVPF